MSDYGFPLPSEDFPPIDLGSPHSCLAEIEACSNGLRYFDHLFGRITDELADAQLAYDGIEAEAIEGARASSSDTAAEIKGRVTKKIENCDEWAEARYRLIVTRNRKTKLTRWIDSLEGRRSAAQSALKGHDTILRGGGS